MSASGTCVRIPGFLCLFPETLAVAFALSRDVVAEHGAESMKSSSGEQPVERLVDECRYGIEAAAGCRNRGSPCCPRDLLSEVADALTFEPFGRAARRTCGTSVQSTRLRTPFAELVDLVQERASSSRSGGTLRRSWLFCTVLSSRHQAATRSSVLSGALSSMASPTNRPSAAAPASRVTS